MMSEVQTTFQPTTKRAPTICRPTCRPLPATAPPGLVRPKALQPFSVAQRPGGWILILREFMGNSGVGHTGANTADNGAYKMGVEDLKGIIDLAHDLRSANNVHRNPGNGA